MKRFERIDKMRPERFNSHPFFAGFYPSLRKTKQKSKMEDPLSGIPDKPAYK